MRGRLAPRLLITAANRSMGRLGLSLMLVIMAIQTQQLPVTAIAGVIVMIVIAVMNCQFAQIDPGEFTGAPATYPRVYL